MGFLPSSETVKQWLVVVVIPPISASVVTWLASHKVLDVIGISGSVASTTFSQTLIWLAGYGITFLGTHHILKSTYLPTHVKQQLKLEQIQAEQSPPVGKGR